MHTSPESGPASQSEGFSQAKLMAELAPESEPFTEQTLAERHPDWPPVKLNIYFSRHDTAADMAGLAEHVQDADIYLYERTYADPSDTARLQKAADVQPDRLFAPSADKLVKKIRGQSEESIIRSVYGTGVIVDNIDLQPGDLIEEQDRERLFGSLIDETSDFPNMLDTMEAGLAQLVARQEQREKIMVERFEDRLEHIVEQHPELLSRPDIKVQASMGDYHTPLFHKFRAAGVDTERAFPQKPYVYSHLEEAERGVAFGTPPDRELLARAYFETILDQILQKQKFERHFPRADEVAYERHIAAHFTSPDIEAVYRQNQAEHLTPDAMTALLAAKGLGELPQTNGQLRQAVERLGAR